MDLILKGLKILLIFVTAVVSLAMVGFVMFP